MIYKDLYENWLDNRKLTHPAPNERDYNDLTLRTVQTLVILGSMALSGTRVGTTLAKVGIFKSFGVSILGNDNPLLPTFTLIEALFAFLTIEAAIFLAGYLTGNDKADNTNWYWGLLYAALGTSIAANLYPMFTLLGGNWEQAALIIVSVITGLCTSIMPYIGGRVLKVTRYRSQEKYQIALDEWQADIQKSWQQSIEYKQWRKSQRRSQPQQTMVKQDALDIHKIAEWLTQQGDPVSLDVVAQEFGVGQNILVSKLEADGRFQVEGFKVNVNGNV